MELYTFGFDASSHPRSQPRDNVSTVGRTLRAKTVKVLWSSWCDAVIAHQNDAGVWAVEYRGVGLSDAQKEHVESLETINRAASETACKIDFFGAAMHDGLRGYVSCRHDFTENEVVVFATDLEIEDGVAEIQRFSVGGDTKIAAVRLASNGSVMVSTVSTHSGASHIVQLKDLTDLRQLLETDSFYSAGSALRPSDPLQFCANSTTATILDGNGQVYTATNDPRYSRCLGRPYTGTVKFEPVPYLSETRISRMASGGYVTAAVSTEGELFLWGQGCPGAKGELSVLKNEASSNGDPVASSASRVCAEDEQDDIVKCLTVFIEGEEAQVYDVAVGHGHVLLAAEVGAKRAVFAAGDDSRGQLGNRTTATYLPDFEEVPELRDKKILELVAAGWSSYAVAS